MLQKIRLLESEYDYKLVRGFFALLERRSIFGRLNTLSSVATPMLIRQKLFEESSKQGLALSDSQETRHHTEKLQIRCTFHQKTVETIMWSDKDENLILTQFDIINH